MGQIRDAGRTRQRILHAAAAAVRQQGPGVSLDAIAQEAGVSKGGLMHHFPTREKLLIALVESVGGSFEEDVANATRETDNTPGSLARAYIRLSFAPISSGEMNDHHLLMAQLLSLPEVRRHVQDDDARWHAAMVEDGLDPRVARLVISATDGGSLLTMLDQHDAEGMAQLEQDLLALTRVAPAVVAVLDAGIAASTRS